MKTAMAAADGPGARRQDHDLPERAFTLDALSRLIDGTLYDHILNDFEDDYSSSSEYIGTRHRRPSIRHDWCRIAVEDSVALLFSESRFPSITTDDETTNDTLADLVKETSLNALMVNVATAGSIGTAVMLFRALGDPVKGLRVFFSRLDPRYLTPAWKPQEPDVLLSVAEAFKIARADLLAAGYAENELAKDVPVFWFQRLWTEDAEIWYRPQTLEDRKNHKPPIADAKRSVQHKLGFVPLVWIKNLPGGIEPDGRSSMNPAAISTMIEADYQLSQAGRGMRYNGEPMLMIKDDGEFQQRAIVGGSTNALRVSIEGDAKLLEISGDATAAVLDYVRHLRASVLEGMRGNRSDADKLAAAQSGRAMELMNQGLIWLADQLRVSYGEGALLSLMRMVIAANADRKLLIDGKPIAAGQLNNAGLKLGWNPWYAPTYSDGQAQAATLVTLRTGGLLSRETAIEQITGPYDIEDVQEEIAAIEADQAADDARLTALAAATNASATVES